MQSGNMRPHKRLRPEQRWQEYVFEKTTKVLRQSL
ncbi:hypothetical protein YSA_01523 [Pseudomonas putida ND6]|uniref:Uncharacterized protein n=1 Tax=Pseudomonas putida ND6 TaxID=231023 RepID=I3UQ31_PSEPU|nr:hypothetical protein YSA_01523 [Pseudomonas putida ND6]